MAAPTAEWAIKWAEQLADIADHVLGELPPGEEWSTIRHFLSDMSRMLRRGDVMAGSRAVVRILPYVQRALSKVEKCSHIYSAVGLAESVSRHFLVDESHRKNVEDFMQITKVKVEDLRARIDKLATSLDDVVDDVISKGKSLSWWAGLKLAFQINRISALIKVCDARLMKARQMIDELDSHVAAKSFLAHTFTYITFLVGLFFSASGNLPVGAACISAAGVTRKAAKSLDKYREELSIIDNNHKLLQAELNDWKEKFKAEKRNFLLVLSFQKTAAVVVVMVTVIYLMGKTANLVLFVGLVFVLILKCQTTESSLYMLVLLTACVACWAEYHLVYGLFEFNSVLCISVLANCIGLIEFWW